MCANESVSISGQVGGAGRAERGLEEVVFGEVTLTVTLNSFNKSLLNVMLVELKFVALDSEVHNCQVHLRIGLHVTYTFVPQSAVISVH